MNAIYAGTRLQNPSSQIRLLICDPSTAENDTPSYSMTIHSLDTSWPEYAAISYTWGDVEPTLPLAVNGHVIRVRLHCWYALWQLRYHGFTGSLWIDTICINQEDNVEKSAQVSMMGQIYKRASSVAACIGSGDTLRQLGPKHDALTTQALDELEQTPYFNRLWIKQEIILAKEVNLYCGTETKSWQKLEQGLSPRLDDPRIMNTSYHAKVFAQSGLALPGVSQPSVSQPKVVQPKVAQPKLATLCEHRRFQLWGGARDVLSGSALLQFLIRYGDSKCVDSRDKVYALLSLLPEDDIAFRYVTVDYGQSAWRLFCQIHAICCHDPSEKVRSQSLFSLSQVARGMNINPQSLEVAQFLHDRLKPLPEPQTLGLLIPEPFIKLPFQKIISLLDVMEYTRLEAMSNASQLLYPEITSGCRASKPGLLTAKMSVAEATAHDKRSLQLPRTGALEAIQNHCFKQVFTSASYRSQPEPNERYTRFMVSDNTLMGDIIAQVIWKEDRGNWRQSTEVTASWAVLRREGSTSIFNLLCWAIPVDTNSKINDTPTKEPFPSYSLTSDPYTEPMNFSRSLGATLKLHHDDALAFIAIAREGLRALATPATTSTTRSHSELPVGISDELLSV